MILSDKNDNDLVTAIQDVYRSSWGTVPRWRREAREAYDFYAGHQWDADDKLVMEEQGRPPVTFNRVAKIIDAISGTEVVNRQEARYLPRTPDDQAQAETWNAAAQWLRDECDAEDEESDAFRDALITGMGWINTHVSYDDNPDGMVCLNRVDPLEMRWDTGAKQRNLADAQWLIREKWVARNEIVARWPSKSKELVPAKEEDLWAMEPHDADNAWKYEGIDPLVYGRGYDPKRKEYRLVEVQWFEYEEFYRSVNPDTGEVDEVDSETAKLREKAVKQRRKKYYRAFIAGRTLLERSVGAVDRFSYECITGKRDQKFNIWYGLMRAMMDPQRLANKFYSQFIHIFNSGTKGGFFYETGALAHPDRAKDDINRPEGMIEVNPGGLGKIQERSQFQIPANLDRLLQYSLQAIPDVAGVNPEFLGQVDREQPGVVENMRTRQAFGIVSVLFDSLRRYRKRQGRLMLEFTDRYIADGRHIRIMGPEGTDYVALSRIENVQYDIIVDQAPNSPNSKTESWVALQQMLPILLNAGFPMIPEIVDYMPLPSTMTNKWKQMHQDPQMQQRHQAYEEEIQRLQKENDELKLKRDERVRNAETREVQTILEDGRERERTDVEKYEAQTKRLKVITDGLNSEVDNG